jgi:asparagine synthase (glutamine-hydrolysing)
MCGITGLAGFAPEDAARIVRAMTSALSHRGPDDAGAWTDVSGLAFGHRRLSVVDLSAAGHQPMRSPSARYVITFNGEIYNHLELRDELERAGLAPAWRGHSDTEVLLAGFDAWGIEATLQRANGMFALALWDAQRRELSLARDRIGEKPLYFGWIGGRFAFASEMKALWHVPGWDARMNVDAIAPFLATGYVHGPHSAIVGVHRLPPGSLLTLALEQLGVPRDWNWLAEKLRRYWSLQTIAANGLAEPIEQDEAGAADALEHLLADSVRLRMGSDVPIGAFLSGGIDSSLVTALMQIASSRPVHTFCIGFSDGACDETPYACAVASHLGTDHVELHAGARDAAELVPTLSAIYDEPFADTSEIPTLLVSRLARGRVTVALSGDGGDELFAGYQRYFKLLRMHHAQRLPRTLRTGIARTLEASSHLLAPLLSRMRATRAWPLQARRLAERLSAFDLEAMALAHIGGGSVLLARRFRRPLLNDRSASSSMDRLSWMLQADQLDYLPDDILHKVDRASMAYGLEARAPMLDHRVIEFSWRLPRRMLLAQGRGKLLLRRILERHVPPALTERPKQGFAPPMGAWLRGPLREWAHELLSPASLAELPLIDAASTASLWKEHCNDRVDASYALWAVLMLADWRRRTNAHF